MYHFGNCFALCMKNDIWGLHQYTTFFFRYHFGKGENHTFYGTKQTQQKDFHSINTLTTHLPYVITSRENEIWGKRVTKMCSICSQTVLLKDWKLRQFSSLQYEFIIEKKSTFPSFIQQSTHYLTRCLSAN